MVPWRVGAIALLVVLAGCVTVADWSSTSAPGATAPTPASEPSPEPGSPSPIPSPSTSPTPGPESTTTPTAANPWGKGTLVVGIRNVANAERDLRPLVAEALAYWERNGDRYGAYAVEFVLEPDAADPDVVVRFTDTVGCPGATNPVGCAPVLASGDRANPPEMVQIESGYTDESTVRMLEHEFGHLLGIGHGEPPRGIMSSRLANATRLPEPNATERAFPWREPTLTVYVEYASISPFYRPYYEYQVGQALSYYDAGAEGAAPANLSLRPTRDRRSADIVVTFPGTVPCRDDLDGTCGQRWGADTDGDGAPEYYAGGRITVAGVDRRAVGWYVGYWLGVLLGVEEPPPPFRDADDGEKRSRWWR